MNKFYSSIKINEFDKVVTFEAGTDGVDSIEVNWNIEMDYPMVTINFEDGTERKYFGSNIVWYERD